MLRNLPPPRTRIRTLTEIKLPSGKTAPAGRQGELGPHLFERRTFPDYPGDQFEVEIDGERVTVRRDQIETD